MIFLKMRKHPGLVKLLSIDVVVFKSARPVYYQLHLNLIYNFAQTHFSSKKIFFAFLTKKTVD